MIILLIWSFRTLATLQGEQFLSKTEITKQVSSLLLFGIGDPVTLIVIHKGANSNSSVENIELILALFTLSSFFSSIGSALIIRILSNIC